MRLLLDPKNDVVFKLLFGAPRHEPVLISFLTAVLKPSAAIKSATVLNPEIPRDLIADKPIFLDVHVALDDGRFIDVEMQARGSHALRGRLLYYWAKAYGPQLQIGEDYRKLCPCIGIYVLDFHELQGQDFHSEEELEALTMSDPSMKEASDALWWVSRDPNSRQIAEMREKSQVAFRHTMAAARDEGRREGLVEGQLEGPRHEIRSLARVLGIELDDGKELGLRTLSAEQLAQVIQSLVHERQWPHESLE